ncbi:hypothetical protein PVAG01_00476 [Phlyctema vagabunda]|uniref:Peptidase A1 domain-containing protein n=1 Tax=Phlyctema vagabunda TaxID=108571 RepID=A0ABR4PUY5_9HELO
MKNGNAFIPALNIGVGTPRQDILSILDTGSSDLWVPQTGSRLCRDIQQQCTGTTFSTNSYSSINSTTSSEITTPAFYTSYVNGVEINGSFVRESVAFGNTTTTSVQIGVGTDGTLPSSLFPIAGLGYKNFEGIVEKGETPYDNTVAGMKSAGLINSTAFGLYLNDFRSEEGSIVFGGYDTAKFNGSLKSVPLVPDNDNRITTFYIKWDTFEFEAGDTQKSKSRRATCLNMAPPQGLPAALIDSGDPAWTLSEDILTRMGEALNLRVVDGTLESLKCSVGNSGAKFTFGFNQGVKIEVPISMLMVPLTNANGAAVFDQQGDTMCQLPVEIGGSGTGTLGAPFLQAAYVVFDMDRNQLLMAPAIMNATTSNIQEYITS